MYTPAVWADFVAGGTPINAAALQHIEQGIADGDVTNPASPAAVLQSATFAAKWQPLTVYAAGFPVLSPNNDLVTAKTAHTSGASFTAANWDLVPTFALANPTLAVTYNGDGSVATTTENGILTTFTYNTDGTVNSQTRAGVTKTFTYGVYGVTGAA
jgi:YD repeat-containing protein